VLCLSLLGSWFHGQNKNIDFERSLNVARLYYIKKKTQCVTQYMHQNHVSSLSQMGTCFKIFLQYKSWNSYKTMGQNDDDNGFWNKSVGIGTLDREYLSTNCLFRRLLSHMVGFSRCYISISQGEEQTSIHLHGGVLKWGYPKIDGFIS